MKLNGAALNVNKLCVTSRKTAFPKDNKIENAENEYPEKLTKTAEYIQFRTQRCRKYTFREKKIKIKVVQN